MLITNRELLLRRNKGARKRSDSRVRTLMSGFECTGLVVVWRNPENKASLIQVSGISVLFASFINLLKEALCLALT